MCLDCEEVHDAQHCPVCASETFAYLTNWVPAPERRARPRPPVKASAAAVSSQVAVGCGVAGAVLFAIARWSKRARERLEGAASREIGELR